MLTCCMSDRGVVLGADVTSGHGPLCFASYAYLNSAMHDDLYLRWFALTALMIACLHRYGTDLL